MNERVIFYRLGFGLYVNVTNACPCACIFCIRGVTDGVGDADSLWLDREPTLDELKDLFDAREDLSEVDEVVFCGYGEPMERAEDVIALARYIKGKTKLPVRLNTNGLVRLMFPDFNTSDVAVFDRVSISLNADDEDEYLRITRPKFGATAFGEMLKFAEDATKFTTVVLTVLEDLHPERIERCRDITRRLGVTLRVRTYN